MGKERYTLLANLQRRNGVYGVSKRPQEPQALEEVTIADLQAALQAGELTTQRLCEMYL